MLKGMPGLRTVFALLLGLGALSLVLTASTVGSLGDALTQGFSEVGTQTDRTIEIEDTSKLSTLTMFVHYRAHGGGCDAIEQFNEWGAFTNLEDTYLGGEPSCFGGDASIIRSWENLILPVDDDNYMTGIFSRENIEIKDNITIERREEQGTLNQIGVVFDRPASQVDFEMEEDEEEDSRLSRYRDAVRDRAIDFAITTLDATGMLPEEITGEELEVVAEIVTTDSGPHIIVYEDADINTEARTNLEQIEGDLEEEEEANTLDDDMPLNAVLCEGDEGYIQTNRGTLDGDRGDSSAEPLFTLIVIENVEHETCEDPDIDRGEVPDGTRTQGRLLYVAGENADEEEYPSIKSTEFGFGLHQLNPDNEEVDGPSTVNYNRDLAEGSCSIAVYVDEGSLIGVYQHPIGTEIPRDGTFPDNEGGPLSDLLHEEGLTGGTVDGPDREDTILYEPVGGEMKFEMQGDLLCAGVEIEDDGEEFTAGKWKMCSEEAPEAVEIEDAEGEYTCDQEEGTWSQPGIE